MPETFHDRLVRQLPLLRSNADPLPDEWRPFLQAVDRAYRDFDEQLRRQELAREQTSAELDQAQARLNESERRHRAFLDADSDLVFLKDDEFRYVVSNRANNEFLGKSEAEVLGRTDFDLMPRAVAEQCRASDQEALRRGTGVVTEETADGKIYQTLKFPVPLANGRTGVGSFVRDVTARRQAEEILRQSEEKFAKIFHTSPYAVLLTRAKDGRILNANDAFVALFGHAKAALLADSTLGIGLWANPEDRAAVVAALRRGETVANREFRFRAKDGRELVGLFSTQSIQIGTTTCLLSSINDITERQRAAERLRESEARLSTALDMARAGYWEYDVAADAFTFDDNFYRIYKTTAAQVGGYRMPSADYARRFCHPDDAPLVAREIEAALASADPGYSRQIEHRIRCGDGSVGHVAVRFFVVKDAQGRTVKTYGVNQNVTERKQAEDKLRASLERLQDVAANVPGAIYQLQIGRTGALEVPFMSSGCEALFERPVAEMDFAGLLFDHMHLGDRALFEHSLAKAAEQMKRWSLEFRIATPEGSAKWLRGSANPRQTPPGGILWNGVLLDITELKRTEESLREREAFQNLLMDTIPTPVFYKDRQGRYLGFNKAFETLFGMTKEQLVGKSVFDIAPPELAKIYHVKDLELFEHPGTQVYEAPIQDAQGNRHDVVLHKAPIVNAQGAVSGLIGIMLDITQRKQAEEQMAKHLDELRRWQTVTLGRENRVAEMKREVNALSVRLGQPPPYPSAKEE